jgi:hypothetical protein
MAENGDSRISVSRETLRAELTALKLDLIQSLASKAEVDRLAERMGAIEQHGSPAVNGLKDEQHEQDRRLLAVEAYLKANEYLVQEHKDMREDVSALKIWRTRLALLSGLIVVSVPSASALVVHYF